MPLKVEGSSQVKTLRLQMDLACWARCQASAAVCMAVEDSTGYPRKVSSCLVFFLRREIDERSRPGLSLASPEPASGRKRGLLCLLNCGRISWALGFPGGASGKEPACQCRRHKRWEFLGQEDPLEEGMATHSSILAWRIPQTEEPGGLQSMGS